MKDEKIFDNNELEIFQMVYYTMAENRIYSFGIDDVDSVINMASIQKVLDKMLVRSELWESDRHNFIKGYEADINDKSLYAVVELKDDCGVRFVEYIMVWSFGQDYQY